MTSINRTGATARIAPAGLAFLAVTSIGWGFNWPVTKFLLGYLPPLTLRGTTGVIGASLLAILALLWGQSLHVPRAFWPRLVLAAILNVGCWMVLMGFALVWLPASEAALIAYTMPVWASILAWPILGERPNLMRVISLLMAFAGLSAILGGNGFAASVSKLPGIIMALLRGDRLCGRRGHGQEAAVGPAADIGGGLADRNRVLTGRDRGLPVRDLQHGRTL